ncbi:MAG: DUF4387 domain-containing protein [Pseudomonadota bacterium]|nr:acyl-CoA synthetase [Rhodospirillaceae bacterium]MBH73470.1 acyl-CoA synthetase [Rhodospirillaceae bacterium]MEE2932562.1 DUF4387 domain-containing protein [Pseudomonadota bacterium]|tara:strand:- start:2261 stop:2572 length:312 start_codon:yes stop_codon:yes gene_type:complete
MTTLSELTSVLRSKNAGALLCTLDLMFEDQSTYEKVRDSGVLTPSLIADLYGLSDNEVSIIPYDVAYAIKITIPRLHKSGDPDDSDIYGAQQHAPLLDIDIPV